MDRNHNVKTVQPVLRAKSLATGSEELFGYFLSRERYAQIGFGVS